MKTNCDDAGQVVAADYSDTAREGFNYDPMGNLNSRTNLDASVDSFTANNLTQYSGINSTAPSYDYKGNLLEWYGGTNTYDAQNSLIGVVRGTNSASFVYDGRNRCIRRKFYTLDAGLWTLASDLFLTYDNWNLIAEYQGTTPVAEYINGPNTDEVLARASASATVYYCGDALNSVVALTDADGLELERYRYTAFGQPTVLSTLNIELSTSAYGNRFMFQGREWFSELNLTDHRNRYYMPELDRWLNRDPLGDRGLSGLIYLDHEYRMLARNPVESWQGANLYFFTRNAPVVFTDKDGLVIPIVIGGVVITLTTAEAVAATFGISVAACLITPPCAKALINTITQAVCRPWREPDYPKICDTYRDACIGSGQDCFSCWRECQSTGFWPSYKCNPAKYKLQ